MPSSPLLFGGAGPLRGGLLAFLAWHRIFTGRGILLDAVLDDVLWFLGGDANTPENRTWLRSMFGSVGTLDFVYTDS